MIHELIAKKKKYEKTFTIAAGALFLFHLQYSYRSTAEAGSTLKMPTK